MTTTDPSRAAPGAALAASQNLTRRMAQGFQHYRQGDLEGAVDGFLIAVFGLGYRQVVERTLPGSCPQAVRDADTFFGIENPELQLAECSRELSSSSR